MLETVPDYVSVRRFKNSLAVLEQRYPDGAPDHIIAAALHTTEADVNQRYQRIVGVLQTAMGLKETA